MPGGGGGFALGNRPAATQVKFGRWQRSLKRVCFLWWSPHLSIEESKLHVVYLFVVTFC